MYRYKLIRMSIVTGADISRENYAYCVAIFESRAIARIVIGSARRGARTRQTKKKAKQSRHHCFIPVPTCSKCERERERERERAMAGQPNVSRLS